MENLTDIIEAILFASGKSVKLADISQKLGVTEAEIHKALADLKTRLGDSGIQLLEFNKKAQLASNPLYKDQVEAVLTPIREKELTRTILECAAIVAYKQPITRAEIEAVRGVSSDYGVSALLELGLIYACGKKDAIGHPTLFATTDEFLKRFKLNSLEDLPDYDALIAAIKTEEERDSYLYAREEWETIDADKRSTLGSDRAPSETPTASDDADDDGAPQKKKEGYDIPDFLEGIDHDDIVKIS